MHASLWELWTYISVMAMLIGLAVAFAAVYCEFRNAQKRLDAICRRLGIDPETGKTDLQPPIRP